MCTQSSYPLVSTHDREGNGFLRIIDQGSAGQGEMQVGNASDASRQAIIYCEENFRETKMRTSFVRLSQKPSSFPPT